MKRRSLTVLLCLLAIISLASVGFASWVISAGDEEVATGSIVVENVTDERLEIKNLKFDSYEYKTETAATDMPKFVFGKSANKTTYNWLLNDKEEKLSITVTFNVHKKDGEQEEITDISKLDLSVVFELVEGKSFAASEDGKFYAEIIKKNPEIVYKDDHFECELELGWGNYFGDKGTNPFDFYNNKKLTDPLAEDAKTKLGAMFAALGNAQYKVTIKVEPKPTTPAQPAQ